MKGNPESAFLQLDVILGRLTTVIVKVVLTVPAAFVAAAVMVCVPDTVERPVITPLLADNPLGKPDTVIVIGEVPLT